MTFQKTGLAGPVHWTIRRNQMDKQPDYNATVALIVAGLFAVGTLAVALIAPWIIGTVTQCGAC